MTEVQGQMSALIAQIAHPEQVLTNSNEQHRRLVELLRARSMGEAVRLMRAHIEGTEHILAGLITARSAPPLDLSRERLPESVLDLGGHRLLEHGEQRL